MRIELNAGGLSGGIAVQSFQNDLSKVSKKIDDVVGAFQTVKKKTNDLTGGVGKLQTALSGIESRIKTDTKKQDGIEVAQQKVGSFIDLALKIDSEAAACVSKNQKELFNKYPSLKPVLPEKKKWYEELWKVVVLTPVGYVVTKLIDNYVRKNIGNRSISEFIFDSLHGLVDGAANFIKKTYQFYEGTIGRIRDTLVTGLIAIGGAVITGIATIGTAAIEGVKFLVGTAVDIVKTVGPAVVSGLKHVASVAWEGLKKMGSAIVDFGKKLLKSIGPAVAIVGGIATVVTCIVAAPVGGLALAGAILIGLYAANTAVNGAVDLYNVWLGDPDKVGKTNVLKSLVTGITGGIGSLFGNKEFGIKFGEVLFAAGEIATVVIAVDQLICKFIQMPFVAPTIGGTLKNIGTGLSNIGKSLPEMFRGIGYIVTQTPMSQWIGQFKLMRISLPAIHSTLKELPVLMDVFGDLGDSLKSLDNYVKLDKLPGSSFMFNLIDFSEFKSILDVGNKVDGIGDGIKVIQAF